MKNQVKTSVDGQNMNTVDAKNNSVIKIPFLKGLRGSQNSVHYRAAFPTRAGSGPP